MRSIETLKELKPGFLRASAIFGKNMVLLFKVDKDVILENHKHPHIQFGYCFSGEFSFNVNGKEKEVRSGDSYLIDTNIPHSAVALSDYYSMDIKIISDDKQKQDVEYDVLSKVDQFENYQIERTDIGNSHIYRIITLNDNAKVTMQSIDLGCCSLMVNKETDIVGEGGIKYTMEPMKIYSVLQKETETIKISKAGTELFVIEIH